MLIKKDRENFYILNWLDTFMVGHKGFIAGGCFKNIFNKEKIKDIDLFFEQEQDWINATEYFDSLCDEDLEFAEYKLYYENDNVKAYKHIKTDLIIELCRKIFGSAQEILEQFDFTITKFAYYKEKVKDEETNEEHLEYKILCDEEYFEHLKLNRLVTNDKIIYPMSTFERMIRYVKYGYLPCRETKIKIANAINNLKLEEIEIGESLYEGLD